MARKTRNKNKIAGLVGYCTSCQRNIPLTSFEKGKSPKKCAEAHPESLAYKMYVHVKGSKNGRKTRILKARTLQDAQIEGLKFRQEVEENNFQINTISSVKKEKEVENTPQLLIHALARYAAWLRNEGVPAHRKKERSNEHVSDVERAFKVLIQCLQKNGKDPLAIMTNQLNDETVGMVYKYLLEEKKFGNRTFNKYLSYYTSFLKWYSEEYNLPARNWFERVKRKRLPSDPDAISKNEITKLFPLVTYENGFKNYESGQKLKRNVYRPYLVSAFKIALLTGLRRENLVQFKFSDVIEHKDGFSYLKIPNIKVNKIQGRATEDEMVYVYIPVTTELQTLLNEMGYQQHRGSNDYVIAPEITGKRTKAMCDNLSRAFQHYYDMLGTGKKLTFRSIRKAYITSAQIQFGSNARFITGHTNETTIQKNYFDRRIMAKAASSFEIFPAVQNRDDELKQLRNESEKQKNLEVEK